MKHEFATINQLIAMLEQAKRDRGGNARVEIRDRYGERIKPTRMEQFTICRGKTQLEHFCFTDEP